MAQGRLLPQAGVRALHADAPRRDRLIQAAFPSRTDPGGVSADVSWDEARSTPPLARGARDPGQSWPGPDASR